MGKTSMWGRKSSPAAAWMAVADVPVVLPTAWAPAGSLCPQEGLQCGKGKGSRARTAPGWAVDFRQRCGSSSREAKGPTMWLSDCRQPVTEAKPPWAVVPRTLGCLASRLPGLP